VKTLLRVLPLDALLPLLRAEKGPKVLGRVTRGFFFFTTSVVFLFCGGGPAVFVQVDDSDLLGWAVMSPTRMF